MSTFEMIKFWMIKELMPLFIVLGVLAGFAIILILWATVEFYVDEFRRWKNRRKEKQETKCQTKT